MWLRLQEDFRLSIITLVGICAVPGIALMGLLRYAQGNNLSAFVDLSLVLIIIAIVVHAWRSSDTRLSGFLGAVCTSGGAVVATMINGLDGLLWLYPCLMVSFFMVRPIPAALINMTSVVLLIVFDDIHKIVQVEAFTITALLLSACSYIYAHRSDQQQERLRSLNYIDSLTGAKNRRAMDIELGSAIANFARTGTRHALAILDVDYFKSVNDSYGHSVGDSILIELVSIVRANIRPYDQVYRYGGEEFSILFSNVVKENQKAVVTKLQQAIGAQLKTPDGQPVTVSLGIAYLSADMTREEWQHHADQAMYAAKAAGRNTAIFHGKACVSNAALPG